MKKTVLIVVVFIVALACIVGGILIHNTIERKEKLEKLQQQHIELEQMVEDFISMLPADFKVKDPDDVGFISNLTISVESLEEDVPAVTVDDYEYDEDKELYNLQIKMKPSLGKYSKEITYREGPAVLGFQGLLANCKWAPTLRVEKGEKNFLTTKDEKKYAETHIYLDEVNFETGEVEFHFGDYDIYVLVKE